MKQKYTAIGLMSGTSLDGVDLSLIQSDGKSIIENRKFFYQKFPQDLKDALKYVIYKNPTKYEIKEVEKYFTQFSAEIVNNFLKKENFSSDQIDVIAFHGHTIAHNPEQKITWQIGDEDLLFAKTQIKVIKNFRTFDIAFGGQGAPLVPVYHHYLVANQAKPTAILNIGGISNITYIASDNENDLEAFDICFGNSVLDDLVQEKTHKEYDDGGKMALSGQVDHVLADRILQNEIFSLKPPKSFDRDDFKDIIAPINNLKLEDSLATFCYMHSKAIAKNLEFFAKKPKEIFICGGGNKNQALISYMQENIKDVKIRSIEEIGYNSDSIESEAFAFLAIRMLKKLPISFQKTTGILPEIDYALAFSQ